jgi:hypothetical protein
MYDVPIFITIKVITVVVVKYEGLSYPMGQDMAVFLNRMISLHIGTYKIRIVTAV